MAQKYKHLFGSINTGYSLFTINILLSKCSDEMSCSSTLYLVIFSYHRWCRISEWEHDGWAAALSNSPHQCPPSVCFFCHILNFMSNWSRNDVKATLRPLSYFCTTVFFWFVCFNYCIQVWMSTDDVNVPYLIHTQIATNKLIVETKSVSILLFEPRTSVCFLKNLVCTGIGRIITFKR